MPTDTDEQLNYQYFYVPWDTQERKSQLAVQIAQHLKQHYGVPLTEVVALKSNLPDELARCASVSERRGCARDGGAVLAFYPSYEAMAKVQHLTESIVIGLEWPTEPLHGSARLHEAYNVVTGEVMSSKLTDASRETLDRIVFEGYKGWHDDIAERMTLRFLGDLATASAYDRELVLAHAGETKSEHSVARLITILDRFEASRASIR